MPEQKTTETYTVLYKPAVRKPGIEHAIVKTITISSKAGRQIGTDAVVFAKAHVQGSIRHERPVIAESFGYGRGNDHGPILVFHGIL